MPKGGGALVRRSGQTIWYQSKSSIGSKEEELAEENLIASSRKTKMEVKSLQKDESIEEFPSLTYFENMCPPNGSQGVILFTTSLRGIRKTFHDCNTIKGVSLHMEYREEFWSKNYSSKAFHKRKVHWRS